ncbi:endonuclease/exonuclease/phosphatase family protein [Nonomuraea ferruginea]
MNYNLCGAVCNHGETGVVDMVHSKIQAEQPDVVTLQETCRSQAERLQELLGDASYKSYFSSSRFWPPAEWEWWPPDLTPTCDTVAPYSAGNAIFVRADISDADDLQFSTGRGIGCVTAAFEIRTRVCTLHGTPDDPTAAKEIEELATDLFPPHLRRMPFILTGDVNVAPDWPSPENPAVGRLYAPEAGGAPETTGRWTSSPDARAARPSRAAPRPTPARGRSTTSSSARRTSTVTCPPAWRTRATAWSPGKTRSPTTGAARITTSCGER